MLIMMVWQNGDDDDYHDDHDHDPHVKEFRQQVAESSRKMQELRAQIQVLWRLVLNFKPIWVMIIMASCFILTDNWYQGKIWNQSFITIPEAFDR